MTAAGTARGVFTLMQPTTITDRWGAVGYGRLTGLLSAPLMITMALAPFAATALAEHLGGYPPALLLLAATIAAGALFSLASVPKRRVL